MESCKNVLVVGGAGYVGGYLTDLLLRRKHFVKVYDNLMYEDRFLKDVNFIFGDVRNTDDVIDAASGCDTVILLAAIVGDPACNVNHKLTEAVNYEAIKNICEKLPQDIHVVFASTCSVYGSNEEYVTEESETKPLSVYASTKLRAEKHVLDRGGTVFRLGTVYGIGDNFSRIRADLVINTLSIKAHTEKEITINGGNQWRPVISVKDIGWYMLEAVERKKEVAGLYNLCYKNVRIADLADDIKAVFPDVKINKVDAMFQDERNYKVKTDKVDSVFNYRPRVPIIIEINGFQDLLEEARIKNPGDILYNNGLYLASKRL
jgi:nucleoside-diphosphate-sugar epimerase